MKRIAILAAIAKGSPGLCPLLEAWQAWADGTPFEWLEAKP